jgi:segregation and condensation protein A
MVEIKKDESTLSYSIKQFEGPLDLLLHLINKAKINIYDIPIAEITEQFLEYLKNYKELSLENLTDFYQMAAHLIYMKSRLLLPTDELPEDDLEFLEMRGELVERLLEYQKYKQYSSLLSKASEGGLLYLNRRKSPFNIPFEDHQLFEDKSVWDLLNQFSSMLKAITPEQIFNVYEEVTTKQKLTLMAELFQTKKRITFIEVVVNVKSPTDIIAAFFALLEAAKFGMIALKQDEIFDEIYIEKLDDVDIDMIEENMTVEQSFHEVIEDDDDKEIG